MFKFNSRINFIQILRSSIVHTLKMFALKIRVLVCLSAWFVSCAKGDPGFQFIKYKHSRSILQVPDLNINYHISRLHELGRGVIEPIIRLGKPNNNVITPTVNYKNIVHEDPASIDKKHMSPAVDTNVETNKLNDISERWDDNFTEVTQTDTTVESTTDVWTTTEDYDEGIMNRIAVPPQALASLLG